MSTYEPADLYRDAAFARRLATGLVGEASSEDVWQAAWLVLLERPPRPGSNLGAYLRTIVQRLGLRHRRREARRAQREVEAARAAAERGVVPSTADIVERIEIHRLVVDALLELEEPYRKTLYLLFFEDLSPAEIAHREGVPVETVRTRGKRAIMRLRERLERTKGGDREWLCGLAVLAGLQKPGAKNNRSAERSPLLAVGVTAALLTVSGLGWITWRARAGKETTASLALADPVEAEEVEGPAPAGRAQSRLALEEKESVPVPPSLAPPSEENALRFFGRVLDPAGAGISAAEVRVTLFGGWGSEPVIAGRTDHEGRYSLSIPALSPLEVRNRNFQIWASAPGRLSDSYWTPVAGVRPSGHETDFVLAPGFILEGRLLDEDGNPVTGGLVLVRSSSEGRESSLSAGADWRGVYRFGFETGVEILGLEAWMNHVGSGFLSKEELPAVSEGFLRAPDLVLEERHRLRGRAVYPDGTPARELGVVVLRVELDAEGRFVPAPSAPVRAGGLSRGVAVTDEEGRFTVPGLREGPWAFEAGSSSMRQDPERVFPPEQIAEESEDATLVVDDHRVIVEVVDGAGAPVPDVRVAFTNLDPAQGGGWRARGESRRTVSHAPNGLAPFFSRPGEALAITVLLPGWAEERVLTVPELPYELHERVELPAATPPGAVRIQGTDPDGGLLREFELRLSTSVARLPSGTWRSDLQGLVHGLPCGEFLATVVPLSEGQADPCLAPAELPDPIPIDAGAPRELSITATRGGKLAVVFQTEEEPEPEDFEHPTTSPDWVMWFPERQDAVLRRAEDPPDGPPFLVLRGAESGKRWKSEHALPAGRYRLEARFAGFEPVEQWIEVEACRANEVRVSLTALPGGPR